VARFAGGRPVSSATTIDELGLSSLERVELMVALEERFGTTIDETAFAGAPDLASLEQVVQQGAVRAEDAGEVVDFPSWNRTWPARALRRISLPTWILPVARVFAWIRVEGLEHLRGLEGPVIFAANHQSHIDTPAILWALPARWRYRVAVAMAKEFFKAHFFPRDYPLSARLTNGLNYYLASLFFNAFPLPQREAGARETLRYIGDLASEGWSVLIFPEGKRTVNGEINPFRPGIGMIGARLGLPVVPVRLEGLHRVLHQKAKMATPGSARVIFGAPVTLRGDDYVALARQVEEAVRRLDSLNGNVAH
jgi:long-chain acyl-CoA synthetase